MLRGALLLMALTGLLLGCGGGGNGGNGGGGDGDADRPVDVTLSSVAPTSGFTTGGDTVVVTGAGFLALDPAAIAIAIGGNPASTLQVQSDTLMTCRTPAGPAGPADVRITGSGVDALIADGFTYYRMPAAFPAADRIMNLDPRTNRAIDPQVCCEGDRVHLVWADDRDGAYDIYVRTSYDGGATWSGETRLDGGLAGEANSWDPAICCEGDRIYVVWSDYRDTRGDIYFRRSLDGGLTWDPQEHRLDTDDPGDGGSIYVRMCCAGERIYVVWEDNRNGRPDIYFNRSLDGGVNWLTDDVRMPKTDIGTATAETGYICCEGNDVYIAWVDKRDGPGDIYVNRSLDAGTTWLASERRVDTDNVGAGFSDEPRICCSGGSVYVVWEDERSGLDDVYFSRSTNRGLSWLLSDVRLETDLVPGSDKSIEHAICCEGESLYIVWAENVDFSDREIRFSASDDGGQTFRVSDALLTRAGVDSPRSPEICCEGNNVYVSYTQGGDASTYDLYFKHSVDGGTSWPRTGTRLNADDEDSEYSWQQSMCCDGARVHVVWEDQRERGFTNPDLYYQRSIP